MHLDQLLFILLIAVAALFQLLTKAAGKANKKSNETDAGSRSALPTNQPPGRPPADTDEERIRRFLEALGQPASSRPPAPVAPRSDIPPRPIAPVQPPPGMFSGIPPRRLSDKVGKAASDRPRNQTVSTPAKIAVEPATAYRAEVGLPEVGSSESDPLAKPSDMSVPAIAGPPSSTDTSIDIASLLASPQGLRQMVVLREIFDAPRGLQAFDVIGSA